MGLEALGKKQYAEIIDNGVTLARDVAEFVKTQSHLELVMEPQLASVLFRFRPESDDIAFVAQLNQRIGDVLLASGSANVGVTEADGITCLKADAAEPDGVPGGCESPAGQREGNGIEHFKRVIARWHCVYWAYGFGAMFGFCRPDKRTASGNKKAPIHGSLFAI